MWWLFHRHCCIVLHASGLRWGRIEEYSISHVPTTSIPTSKIQASKGPTKHDKHLLNAREKMISLGSNVALNLYLLGWPCPRAFFGKEIGALTNCMQLDLQSALSLYIADAIPKKFPGLHLIVVKIAAEACLSYSHRYSRASAVVR